MTSSANECVVIDDCDLTDDEPGPCRLIHKPGACKIEVKWFEQEYQKPSGQVIDCSIDSDDISKYKNLIWNQPHDRMVPGYGLTPRELASIPSDGRKGWLVSSHFFWLSRCLNNQQSQAKCFVFDPHLRQEAVDKLLPVSCRSQVRTLILVMCVGRQDNGVVFFGTNRMQGDHWAVSVVDVMDGTIYYCDTLGWPAPPNLSSNIIVYTRSFGLVHTKQLKVKMAHCSNNEQHSCCDECTNYPLQTCSDVCGVVVMICTAIAAFDGHLFKLLMQPLDRNLNLYLTDPTECSTYLRYVLMSWLARESVDMSKISLKSDFNPHALPPPRSLAKRFPMKRKISSEFDAQSSKNFIKDRRMQQQTDALSGFIINVKKSGLTSQELLRETLQFTDKGVGKKFIEESPFCQLCERLTFNTALERCQDEFSSLREYVQEFVTRPDNPLIFLKMPGKELDSESSKTLEKNDFLMALQTPFQKHLLESYGKQCICVDLSRKSEKFGLSYNLYTISVFYEGIYEVPVAWLLSNSCESVMVRHFFEAVRRNVGAIQTDIFIGDVHNNLSREWSQIFPKPRKRVFYIWEVFQVLHRQMRNSISDQEVLLLCKEYLNVIRFITDEEAFHIYITAFLVVVKKHSLTFWEYFQEKFLNDPKAEYWATCYRVIPQSRTVPFLKQFQETLKTIDFFDGGALNRIDVVVHKLMQLSIYLERSLIEISSEVKQASVLRNIQRKHQQRSVNFDFYQSVSGDEWCIRASDDNNFITILDSGNEVCECVFKCESCNICLHRYSCSCSDYLLNSGGCVHIHVLHTLKKVNGMINSEETLNSSHGKTQKRNLDNGSVDSTDKLKTSVQRQLVQLSDQIYKSNDTKRLRCLLKSLQDIQSS